MGGLGLASSNDESLRALNFILEAWEEASESGIRPQLVAYAAIYTALSDLVASYGEDEVAKLMVSAGRMWIDCVQARACKRANSP